MVFAFLGIVVFIKVVALKAGSNTIGRGHHPLQEGAGLVMCGSSVDCGVSHIFAGGGRERRCILAQIREMSCGFQCVPGYAGVGGVNVRMVPRG